MHEEGHIGAQRQRQTGQTIQRPMQIPKVIERQQRGCRVGTAAAQASPGGHALVNVDVGAERGSAGLLQRARRAQTQIVVGQGRRQIVPPQRRVSAALNVQRVGPIDQHEHRLQRVVAVGTAPDHMQEQVHLCRRTEVVQRFHGVAAPAGSSRARIVTAGAASRLASTQPSE